MIGHISFDMKVLGERSAGNPHATFDVAGVGSGEMGIKPRLTAPILDLTCERPMGKFRRPTHPWSQTTY